jgi:hypothetical protein
MLFGDNFFVFFIAIFASGRGAVFERGKEREK